MLRRPIPAAQAGQGEANRAKVIAAPNEMRPLDRCYGTNPRNFAPMEDRIMASIFSRATAWAAVAGLAALTGAALAQEANYAGEAVDPVSGYRCVTPFCETVALPDTSCLCQKINPNETRRAELRYVCTDMATRQECSASPK
jgi:hypothetical protein